MAQEEITSLIIPFDRLGAELSREGHWTGSFGTGIGYGESQFTIERENFGDADSPMLTHVISDKGMKGIAATLGAWHAGYFLEHAEEYDGDTGAMMGSSYGNIVWHDYETLVRDLVPYLDELDLTRFNPGDRVFDIDTCRYGVVRTADADTAVLEDGTAVDPLFLLKATDRVFLKAK